MRVAIWYYFLILWTETSRAWVTMSDSSFRPERKLFDKFVSDFKKPYRIDTTEGETRFHNFCSNMDLVKQHNLESKSYKLGMNQFADENMSYLKKTLLVCNFSSSLSSSPRATTAFKEPVLSLPPSVDWVSENKVSRVKNQGSCGSCWAFSTTGAIESMLRIRHNKAIDLSEQQLVDCSSSNHACDGGLMNLAVDDINVLGGLHEEKDYPYTAKRGGCRLDYKKIVPETKNLEYDFVRPFDIQEMKQQLASKGPMCSAVEVDPFHFLFYKEGVYDYQKEYHRLNHAVLLTAYHDDQEIPYWVIKNSWGTSWGENGYMRMAIKDQGEGVAGVHLYNMYLK